MISIADHTEIVDLGNGWYRLDHVDSYKIWLKTFKVVGMDITVCLDDWSVAPISLHRYNAEKLVIDEDWKFLTMKTIFKHTTNDGDMQVGMKLLQEQLPSEVFQDIERIYLTYIYESD